MFKESYDAAMTSMLKKMFPEGGVKIGKAIVYVHMMLPVFFVINLVVFFNSLTWMLLMCFFIGGISVARHMVGTCPLTPIENYFLGTPPCSCWFTHMLSSATMGMISHKNIDIAIELAPL